MRTAQGGLMAIWGCLLPSGQSCPPSSLSLPSLFPCIGKRGIPSRRNVRITKRPLCYLYARIRRQFPHVGCNIACNVGFYVIGVF